ncbi:hypothetical protein JW898_02585 [Candidatus Woesearchaeota archaeon]|nr:hypothetical protein [Candidatus Woesearchaeota archaeon]
METKQEVTNKFIVGLTLIIASLVIGKLVLIPIILFTQNLKWESAMIITYIFSWVILFTGIGFAGWEGYRLVTHKYREYQRRTIEQVKHHSRKAAEHTKNAAYKTKEMANKTRCVTLQGVDRLKKNLRASEKELMKGIRRKRGL